MQELQDALLQLLMPTFGKSCNYFTEIISAVDNVFIMAKNDLKQVLDLM